MMKKHVRSFDYTPKDNQNNTTSLRSSEAKYQSRHFRFIYC